jgi:hypothetical protein
MEETNDDLVLGENDKAKKRSASADPINRINGKRSADPTVRGPRSVGLISKRHVDHTQEDAQLDTPAPRPSVSTRDAAPARSFYPSRWFGEKSLGYLRYTNGVVQSKRDPEPINRSVQSRDEHRGDGDEDEDENEVARRSIWSDGLIDIM